MNTLQARLSPAAIAKAIITGEIDLDDSWSLAETNVIFNALSFLNISTLLKVIDTLEIPNLIEPDLIPQFGKIENVWRVPTILVETSFGLLTYSQLGFYLKNDITSIDSANLKFGENHGKCAGLLGLALIKDDKVHLSALSYAFGIITDSNEQKRLGTLLCFRIPSVQLLLQKAKYGKVNGYDHMAKLSPSTIVRRSSSLRTLLSQIRTLDNAELNNRLENIVWEKE